jgi:glycosyltransferase involved in cell wall biosynthesis
VNIWIIADIPRGVPGGMLRHMESHAEGLRRLGHQASVFCAEDLARTGVRSIDARVPGTRSLARLLGRCRREAPDVVNVHTTSAPAWIAAERLGLLGKTEVVVMSYGADERTAQPVANARGLLRRLRLAVPARTMLPRADGVWCVNSEDRAFIMTRYRLPADRVALIPHAAADVFYSGADTGRRQPDQVLFVGSWIPRKGIDVLAKAVPRLLDVRPATRVVLAGVMADEGKVRSAFPERVQPALRVFPLVTPEEARDLYASSALMLVPSEVEGLPIVLLEGMAAGCPSLSAANSGMLDVIREGENGWLLASRDPEAWVARTAELLSDAAGLKRAGEGARRTAERFRTERVAAEAVAFYEHVSTARAGRLAAPEG